jgi:hypothetical protein
MKAVSQGGNMMIRFQFPYSLGFRTARARVAGVAVVASAAGIMLAPVASAATTSAATAATGSTAYSATNVGYTVSGRYFRYVQTEVRLPSNAGCAQLYKVIHGTGTGSFSVGAWLARPPKPADGVEVSDTPASTGCGTYRLGGPDASRRHAVGIAFSPGDLILLSVYYDQGNGTVTANASDLTAGTGLGEIILVGKATFTAATVGPSLNSYTTAPASQFQAFAFTNSAATTYTGIRSTLTGPWTTSQVVMTSNGKSTGTVEASNPVLWDGGANFGTWIRRS